MKRVLAVVSTLLILPGAIVAQAVIGPQKPLAPAQAEVRDALVQIRDSLIQVKAAVAQLDRGAATASDALLRSRSRGIATACEHATQVLPRIRDVVAKGKWEEAYPTRRQHELLEQFGRLAPVLETCGREWRSMSERGNVGEARKKGAERGAAVQKPIMEFETASEAFLLSLGIRIRPKGAGPSPIE